MIVPVGGQPQAPLAVVIGLVSTEDRERILETLQSLHERQGQVACEVVLADRRRDQVSSAVRERFPQVRIIDCPAATTLPEMRTLAFEQTRAPLVAVTEDHCVPADGWAGEMLAAFAGQDDSVAAIGGVVENGVKDTGFDWATYLCEYSAFSAPVAEGPAHVLPGMNVAYRRAALEAAPREVLLSGFWETTLHPRLIAEGQTLLSRNSIKMFHCKKFSVGLFFQQRYVYSRYYAGLRFAPDQRPKRAAAAAASLALPPLLFARMVAAASSKRLMPQFLRAAPALAALVVVWSLGEIWGYLFGPGDALARIE